MGIHHQIVTLAVLGICPDCRERDVQWEQAGDWFGKTSWSVYCESCDWQKSLGEIDVTLAYTDEYAPRKDEWLETYEGAIDR